MNGLVTQSLQGEGKGGGGFCVIAALELSGLEFLNFAVFAFLAFEYLMKDEC